MTSKIQPYNYLTFQNTEKTLNYLVNAEKLFCLSSFQMCALFSGEVTSENFQQQKSSACIVILKTSFVPCGWESRLLGGGKVQYQC